MAVISADICWFSLPNARGRSDKWAEIIDKRACRKWQPLFVRQNNGTMVRGTCGQDDRKVVSSSGSLSHSLWVGLIGGVFESSV